MDFCAKKIGPLTFATRIYFSRLRTNVSAAMDAAQWCKHGEFVPVESRSLDELFPWAGNATAPTIEGKRGQGQLI